jgi:hypothetical protein
VTNTLTYGESGLFHGITLRIRITGL